MTVADFSLDGNVALVTGASRGLGRAISVTMAEAGADVIAIGRDAERLKETAASVEAHGRRCEPLIADVTSGSDLRSVVERGIELFGTIEILVNNAGVDRQGPLVKWEGIPGVPRKWDALHEHSWDLVQTTNLRSVFLACQAAGPLMLERGRGSIINIASVEGSSGYEAVGDTAYAASKAGVIHFTRSLALEWARFGVRVNAISPGAFWTDMWAVPTARLAKEQREHLRRQVAAEVPMERWGELRDIGLAAVFLASTASSYVTGENLNVDGGLVAR